jgi:hypothetical protein
MDNRSGLIFFAVFVLLFVFAFVFCLESLNLGNVTYGVLAMVGFVVCLAGSLINGVLIKKDGGALALWYFSFAVIVGIIMIWYMTRCGSAFGFWQP